VIKRLPRVANLAPLKVVTEDSPHTTAAKRLSPTHQMWPATFDAGDPPVRFDERGWETGRCRMAQATGAPGEAGVIPPVKDRYG
jgi:hypothetical protein